MPRLLLVDDNPSIHRIAESLLAPTDVSLVCVGSAAEALDRLGRGESFDVALVDTAMPDMDGWALVSRLRVLEATATMPIALMAGVLDPVDPVRLASAPVQGFLKKPIELRELGDRVKALMATPVPPPAPSPSPFSTVPATPARELLQRAEAALPEFRPEPEAPVLPEVEEDLLLLTAEDVWREEPIVDLDELPEVQLELEELDLGSLPLEDPRTAPEAPSPESSATVAPEPVLPLLPDLEDLDLGALPENLPDLHGEDPGPRATSGTLPGEGMPQEDLFADLAPLPESTLEVLEPALKLPEPEMELSEPELELPEPEMELSEPALKLSEPELELPEPERPEPALELSEPELPEPALELPEPESGLSEPELPEPVLDQMEATPMAAEGQAVAVYGQDRPLVPGADAQAWAVVQAILADPVLVDALVKAVVARMGDQAIREIAWEVLPDLAGKLRP